MPLKAAQLAAKREHTPTSYSQIVTTSAVQHAGASNSCVGLDCRLCTVLQALTSLQQTLHGMTQKADDPHQPGPVQVHTHGTRSHHVHSPMHIEINPAPSRACSQAQLNYTRTCRVQETYKPACHCASIHTQLVWTHSTQHIRRSSVSHYN